MDRWGYYALALLCAAVILLSALWTREEDRRRDGPDAQALMDGGQRLSEVTPPPETPALVRPAAGKAIRGFSESAVFFEETGVWQCHPGVDFAAEAGEAVLAMEAGTVQVLGDEVRLDHGGGVQSRYRGLRSIRVKTGQRVRAGDALGEAGGRVPFEGAGHVCVSLMIRDQPAPFGWEWLTNE